MRSDRPLPATVVPPDPPAMTRRRFGRLALTALGLGGVAGVALVGGCSSGDDSSTGAGDAGGSGGSGPSGGGSGGSGGSGGTSAVLYASPTCGCCGEYASFLGENGFDVDVQRVDDLPAIKSEHGVPSEVESCHTTLIGDYFVEGHVPLEAVEKLLDERPAVDGIALPGMPIGTPGMPGPKEAPYEVVSVTGGELAPYLTI